MIQRLHWFEEGCLQQQGNTGSGFRETKTPQARLVARIVPIKKTDYVTCQQFFPFDNNH
jgi:hypothetical protein